VKVEINDYVMFTFTPIGEQFFFEENCCLELIIFNGFGPLWKGVVEHINKSKTLQAFE
jgi:hypothetical protein